LNFERRNDVQFEHFAEDKENDSRMANVQSDFKPVNYSSGKKRHNMIRKSAKKHTAGARDLRKKKK
jgi:hypothetical protein